MTNNTLKQKYTEQTLIEAIKCEMGYTDAVNAIIEAEKIKARNNTDSSFKTDEQIFEVYIGNALYGLDFDLEKYENKAISNYEIIDELVSNYADGATDIYNRDLWLTGYAFEEFITQAVVEGLVDTTNFDLIKLFQAGQYLAYQTFANDLVSTVERLEQEATKEIVNA